MSKIESFDMINNNLNYSDTSKYLHIHHIGYWGTNVANNNIINITFDTKYPDNLMNGTNVYMEFYFDTYGQLGLNFDTKFIKSYLNKKSSNIDTKYIIHQLYPFFTTEPETKPSEFAYYNSQKKRFETIYKNKLIINNIKMIPTPNSRSNYFIYLTSPYNKNMGNDVRDTLKYALTNYGLKYSDAYRKPFTFRWFSSIKDRLNAINTKYAIKIATGRSDYNGGGDIEYF